MLTIDYTITPEGLGAQLDKMFELAGQKIINIEKSWDPSRGTPVFTINGSYTSRGWTEWTQGFQFGCAVLQFDGTDEKKFLSRYGKRYIAAGVDLFGFEDRRKKGAHTV